MTTMLLLPVHKYLEMFQVFLVLEKPTSVESVYLNVCGGLGTHTHEKYVQNKELC